MSDTSDLDAGLSETPPADDHCRTVSADERPSDAVVAAVAALVGRPVDRLSPLYDAVDPDALDSLLESNADASLRFTYEGCRVDARRSTVRVRRHDRSV